MGQSHVADANRYAREVVAGKIPAGKYVRLACQRHLDDLKREKDKAFRFRFDKDEANSVCALAELLPHTKGKWAQKAERIKLEPWQKFLLCCLFGWLKKRSSKRRFRKAYLEIPRKNGKSVVAAVIAVKMLAFDGEFGAEVYSGATTEKQAWEVFRPAKQMIERSPELSEAVGAEVWAKAVVLPADGSRLEPVIGKPGDGASPSCAIADEYHEHDTPDLVDTMETGMGAREQPLLVMITTAGFNLAGPCYDQHLEVRRVLDGAVENDELFGCIWSLDERDDWADPQNLRKANPNFGVSVDGEFLEAQQRQAVLNPIQQNRFKTKHLNVWCSARAAWMNMQQWHLAADSMLTMDELIAEGAEAYIAVDMASKLDLASEQILFRRMLAGKPHYYLFGRYWLPEETIEEPGRNQAAYRKWVISGHLTPTPGATIDYDTIAEQVIADMRRTTAREFVFDPFNAVHLSQMVAEAVGESVQVVEFQQKPWNFAVPMDEITAALKDGRFHHDGNPITTWCVANVVAKVAKKDMFSPTKEKPEQKIDGAVAAIMAMARAIVETEAEPQPGIVIL